MKRFFFTCLILVPLGYAAVQDAIPRDATVTYSQLATQKTCTAGETIVLDLPLSPETEITHDVANGRLRVFYPTQFNDLTEGWNWHPEEVAAGRDYYTTSICRSARPTNRAAATAPRIPLASRWNIRSAGAGTTSSPSTTPTTSIRAMPAMMRGLPPSFPSRQPTPNG